MPTKTTTPPSPRLPLAEAYQAAGVAIDVITSRHNARHVRAVPKRLREGELQGVASVGALVEGFDMPRMKIAADHRPHRTLAPRLQLVGRIARVTGGEAHAELVAARTSFSRETRELYREDTAWTRLLPEVVDAAIEWERVRRVYVSEADVTPAEISPTARMLEMSVGQLPSCTRRETPFRAARRYLPKAAVWRVPVGRTCRCQG